jgi:hypothetical protein
VSPIGQRDGGGGARPDKKTGRRLLLIALAASAALTSWQAIVDNRERRELDAEELELDRSIAEKQKIARDLPRYRSELEDLRGRLAELRRRTTPDLGALKDRLRPLGVSLVAGPAAEDRQVFTISAAKTATLAPAFREVDGTGHHIDALRVEVNEEGWTADLVARIYVPPPPPPPPPEKPIPWYGAINAPQRARLEEKRKRSEELDQAIGPEQEPMMKRELSLRLKSLEGWESDPIDLVDLALQLFATENPAFFTGRLERAEEEPRGGMIGRLARPMEDPEIVALFGSLEARIVRRFRDTVEITFVSR